MNVKKRIVPLFLIFLLIASMFPMIPFAPYSVSATGGAWWNSSWNKRILVTINSTAIPSGSVKNFVVLVKPNSDVINKSDAGGKSIRFTDYAGTKEYYYDIDQMYNVNSSTVTLLWVNVSDAINHGGNFQFYMYFNNSNATKGERRDLAWDEYIAVFHMNEASGNIGSHSINHVTGAAEVPTKVGTHITYQSSGVIGQSVAFSAFRDSGFNMGAAIGHWRQLYEIGRAHV